MEVTLLFAAATGVAPLWLVAKRSGPPDDLADRALGAAVIGLFAGRLVAMIEVGVNPLTSPGDIMIIRGGVSTVGATIAALATIAWSARRDTVAILAALTPAALVGLAGWHAGCLFRDACLGTSAPFGRHPTELYAAALYLIGAAVAWRLRDRAPDLTMVGAGLAWAAGVRLLTEPLRPSLTGGPRVWYGLAVAIGLALTVAGLSRKRKDAEDLREP
jgi:prolipoprotein diacylglyceryltransferase